MLAAGDVEAPNAEFVVEAGRAGTAGASTHSTAHGVLNGRLAHPRTGGRRWDADGSKLGVLRGHAGNAAVFSPGGLRVVTAYPDGLVRLSLARTEVPLADERASSQVAERVRQDQHDAQR